MQRAAGCAEKVEAWLGEIDAAVTESKEMRTALEGEATANVATLKEKVGLSVGEAKPCSRSTTAWWGT